MMLYRRFALVTLVIALSGVVLAHVIEATQPRADGFAVETRLNGWANRDKQRACRINTNLCAAGPLAAYFI